MGLTRQEAFDKVWNAMADQNWQPSMRESGLCAYRGQHGRRCAIGALLTDEEAKTAGLWDIGHIMNDACLSLDMKSLEGLDTRFLVALQGAHDSAARHEDPIPMPDGLRDVAGFYRLRVP